MKLYVDKSLQLSPEKIKIAGDFCLFCAENLPIEGEFKVYMVADRDKHGIVTTAIYEVGNNCCRVYCKNRALADCLRSIAHEMTHMMQDQMGLIRGPIRDAGGFHEDQANSRAGELLKRFVAEDKQKRKSLYESFKF